ncbi:MAG: DUF2207 domain-containing protein [Candidatus Levybacteria bacterium]|nr:DUF2207 domain-containing protein [Candidatus Levybacteria bacterium]
MKRFYFLILGFVFIFLLFPLKANAAEKINSFDAEIVAHKDGTMEVTEKIVYDFSDSKRHGIYRDIPLVSKISPNLFRVIKINFKNIIKDGVEENYYDNSISTQASVKIGKANVEITGVHTYTISYLVENGIGSNFADHDEIYWNVTGSSWPVPILQVSANLTTDFGAVADKAVCYTGLLGSKEKNCDNTQISFISTTNSLRPYEGLTVVWNFPKNTFPPSILERQAPQTQSSNPFVSKTLIFIFLAVPIILNFIFAPLLFLWYFKFKRKKSLGKPAVNFDIPKDNNGLRITPAEAGSNDIYKVDRDDIIATLFDLAIRKYIKIEQVKSASRRSKTLGIFGEDEDYIVTKLKDYNKGTSAFEKILLNRLFEKSDTEILSSLKKDFYETFGLMEKEIFNSLIARGFYFKNPKLQMTLLLFFGIIIFFIGGPMLGVVMIYLSRKLNGRTKLGDEMDLKIDGLKIFLKNMKRNYDWQAKNLYVVEQMIPYAIALGFIKEFMEQLKEIYPDYKPSWYRGNLGFYLAANSIFSSMNSTFATSAPSSSSGFSGGFSGGGGGGGGGGSW